MDQEHRMKRLGLGVVTIGLLVGAGAGLFFPEGGAVQTNAISIAWRLAIVTGLWWLAYPEVHRLPKAFWWSILGLLVAVLFGPKRLGATILSLLKWWPVLLPIAAVLFLLWKLRPNPPR